jgi:hypothetical protein
MDESNDQVILFKGPLNHTQDGHPLHEGQTATKVREICRQQCRVTKLQFQELVDLLFEGNCEDYLPSIERLRRRVGIEGEWQRAMLSKSR